jgi:hypothetical protein
MIEVARNVLWSLPQKVVESLELTGTSGNLSKSRPSNIAGPQGTGALRSLLSPDEDGAAKCAGISKITSGCLTLMTSSFYSPPSIRLGRLFEPAASDTRQTRSKSVRAILAKHIIAAAMNGERDLGRLRDGALLALAQSNLRSGSASLLA